MTTPFTPEHLSSSLQVWLDGQDPNGNDRASLPSHLGTRAWVNKGKKGSYAAAFNLAGSDTSNATIPKHLAEGSIVKLAITNAGAGYTVSGSNSGVLTDYKIWFNGSAALRGTKTKLDVNLSIVNGQVVGSVILGGSQGYKVGDTLEEFGAQNTNTTNAIFTVTEVTYRGGMLFNSEPSVSDHYRMGGAPSLTDITIFIACNLRADYDTTASPFFTLTHPNYSTIEIALGVNNASAYVDTVKYNRKDNDQLVS